MNGSLLKRMLQLILTDYKADFKVEMAENPNMSFGDTFRLFHNPYRMADENNKDFPALLRKLDEWCLLYSSYLNEPHTNDEMADTAI